MTPARPRRDAKPAELVSLATDEVRTLEEYDRKRDFERTPEPPGEPRSPDPGAALTFVVQKHAARRLHYDFRLEWDGVMPSWAIPKGPSARIGDRHLAVHVEDHPLDYQTFEGYIPKGEYGGGEVIVWDCGTYSPDDDGVLSFHDRAEAERRMREGLAAGKLSIRLRGKKMQGSWALVRTAKVESGREQWLLLKHRDEAADPARALIADDRSVRSGLMLDELQRGLAPDPTARVTAVQPLAVPGARHAPFPAGIEPMQAELRDGPFSDPRWVFEPKLDGMRTLALLRDGRVELHSRRGLDATARYPGVAAAVGRQPTHTLVLDGEVVALDEQGVPSFERLQERMHLSGVEAIARAETTNPVVYYVFDLLYLDGLDLRAVPLEDRRELLARVLLPTPRLRLLDQFEADGEAAYAGVIALGLEGLVAKRRDSTYEAGKRSRAWLKIKARQTDEFVVGGYAAGEGARAKTFGSLLVGQYDQTGRLVYASHVGSGFDDRTLASLRARLDLLATAAMPFAEPPPKDGRFTSAHGAPRWVRPELVVEVQFAQRTRDGGLRAPVFYRLREDKDPSEVIEVIRSAVEGIRTPAPATSLDAEVASVLEQLNSPRKAFALAVGPHEVKLGNLDKALWPATDDAPETTKRDLLRYYASMARWLLPHLRDRPLTMTRYPNGITAPFFYQKHVEDAPAFVETVRAHSETGRGDQTYLLCNNLATLLWLGQAADLALHTSLARVSPEPDGHHLSREFTGSREQVEASLLNYPDFLLFDLDPYIYAGFEGAGEEPELNREAWHTTAQVARWLKQLLDAASLPSFIKTSGATGLHIYAPVVRQYDYATLRALCETFATFLRSEHPREVTIDWSIPKRAGKVFLDHNQNARFKNLAAPFSPRAKPGAPVSMPLRWDELDEVYPTQFTIRTALARMQSAGDPWAAILDAKHDLRALIEGGAGVP